MKPIFCLLFCVCSLTLLAQAPYPNVKIAEGKPNTFGPCEPSICIDPSNPDRVVAGSVLNSYFFSEDGGKTWEGHPLRSAYGVYGDPCIVADQQGNFYYFHLSDPTGQGWASPRLLDRIVCQRSEDGGKTWNAGSYAGEHHPKDQDKEWAIVDPANGHIYLTWTEFDLYESKAPGDSSRILFSRSTDKGDTWSEAVAISQIEGNCLDDDGTTEGAVPAVGPNGEVYVAWSVNEQIYFDRSTDGGKTWMEQDKLAAKQPGGWVYDIPGLGRANGLPITLCDLSEGPHRGTIYVNYSDQRNGEDDTDIWLVKSTDAGDSWSEPIRVNDDAAGKHQFFNWATVDPATGTLYVVYYDRRAHEGNQTDVYLAYSTDGGETFTNIKINESTFEPTAGVFFGDYNHISAEGGRVRPIWTQMDGNGLLSIWTALIEMEN